MNLHIKRKHKGGNKSDREKYAKELFLALKSSLKIPTTKMNIPDDFIKLVKEEFLRLKKNDFEEEFDPSSIFRYNISNFEKILNSQSEEYLYDDNISKADRDSISVNRRKDGNNDLARSSISEDDDKNSRISVAKSVELKKREIQTNGLTDLIDKKIKK